MKIGFIGAGNMAEALLRGALYIGIDPASIGISDINLDRLTKLAELGLYPAADNIDLVNRSDIIVLAVKPVFAASVLDEIKPALNDKAIVSVVAGLTVSAIKARVSDSGCRVLRIMPNLPVCVGAGATLICKEHTLTDEEFAYTQSVLKGTGECFCVDEVMLENATAITGSGPAYAFMFIEAMADAAVLRGIPRSMAFTMAAHTLLGAAKTVIETERHPAVLKDAVCSPGGMTIEAVRSLEKSGFRSAMIEAVNACAQKGFDMKNNEAKQDTTHEIRQPSNAICECRQLPNLGEQTKLTGLIGVDEKIEPKITASHVDIYTDGACSGNPGPGGWGVILEYDGNTLELSGFEAATTNNRMELFAALAGLRMVSAPCDITLYADSTYLINAFKQKWLVRWQLNGWKTSDGNDVLNQDLWAALLDESSRHNISFVKVKGHSDNRNNNRCDELARQEITRNTKKG